MQYLCGGNSEVIASFLKMFKSKFILACLLFVLSSSLVFAKEEWQSLDSEHFIIYFRAGMEDFAPKVKEKAEDYYLRIIEDLGFGEQKSFLEGNKITIYLYADKEEYLKNTAQPAWSGGCADYQKRSISGFRQANTFLFSVLPHEISHMVFREFVGFNPNIPAWLDEGVASFIETHKNRTYKRTISLAAKNGNLWDLEELSNLKVHEMTGRDKVDLYYAQSVALVDFLIEKFGKAKFSQFCLSLKSWVTFDEALAKNYPYHDLKALSQAWEKNLSN